MCKEGRSKNEIVEKCGGPFEKLSQIGESDPPESAAQNEGEAKSRVGPIQTTQYSSVTSS